MGVLRGEKNVSKKNLFSGKRGAFHWHSAFPLGQGAAGHLQGNYFREPSTLFLMQLKSFLSTSCVMGYNSHNPGLCVSCSREVPAVWVAQGVLGHEGVPSHEPRLQPCWRKAHVSLSGWTRPFHNSIHSKDNVWRRKCGGV